MALTDQIKALTFDVFGTVVDWRSSIIRETRQLGAEKGIDIDWVAFTDRWRALYQPAMEKVRSGEWDWLRLDDLHRYNLDRLLDEFGIDGLDEIELHHLNRVWHRLDPWPDSVPGMRRLKSRYILASLSNGNVALIVNMARRAGIPWNVVLGAEVAGHYKPQPEAYLGAAELLDLEPRECLMVAAHNGDLRAAASCGFRTAFVARPTEYGPDQREDLQADPGVDLAASDMQDLARQLGC